VRRKLLSSSVDNVFMSEISKLLRATNDSVANETDLPHVSDALAKSGTPPLPLIEDDPDLVPLLRQATNEELAPLVAYIIEKGGITAELVHTYRYIQNFPNHRMYADDIAAEIQRFGANTIANLFRDGRGKPYREILVRAAKKSGMRVRAKDEVAEIELRIISLVLGRAWHKMPREERQELIDSLQMHKVPGLKGPAATGGLQALIQAAGFGPYKLAVIAANAVATPVLGHGLSLAANAALTKSISIFAGPVGWAISALWLTTLATGPAYRVIMPCILQVALIRQAALVKERAARRRRWLWSLIICLGILLVILLGEFLSSYRR